MDGVPPTSFGGGSASNQAPTLDPRLRPTPDYGTLGPGSDIPATGTDPIRRTPPRATPIGPLVAALIGLFAALLVGSTRRGNSDWSGLSNLFSEQQNRPASAKDLSQIDRMRPQKQAETLLELAVGQTQGAAEQISSRVDRWHGQVHWNSQIATLSTAALNSNDMRVRESGVEVELAAYGLAKNSASLNYLLKTVDSSNGQQKIWALWALGLMANRGVQPEQVVNVLKDHLKDADVESRRWAVEALALTGSDLSIEPLLKTMHDDPSPLVRERAACSVAESGLFTEQQRMTAVPQLLNYTDDATLDAQTHAWAFHALNDITHQHLPNDSAAWRNWYSQNSGQ